MSFNQRCLCATWDETDFHQYKNIMYIVSLISSFLITDVFLSFRNFIHLLLNRQMIWSRTRLNLLRSDRMADERHSFNPLTWSDQQISAACCGKTQVDPVALLAALQSHSISHFPTHSSMPLH